MVPRQAYKCQGQVSRLQQLSCSEPAPFSLGTSPVLSSLPTRGQRPKEPQAVSWPLELPLWCLSQEPWLWWSCHVGPSAATAKVTIDDQNWGCPETQLRQGSLICPALEWSRAWHKRLWRGLATQGAARWPYLIPAVFDARPALQGSGYRSRQVGGGANHTTPCTSASGKSPLSVWPGDTCVLGMQKPILRNTALSTS